MDLLADILRQAGLKQRILNQRLLEAGASLPFPCSKSMGFHVVVSGQALIHAPGLKSKKDRVLTLEAGDVAWMARGCHHRLEIPAPERGRGGSACVISGAYQFWHDPVHPFFKDLPDWFILSAPELGRLDTLSLAMELLSREIKRPELGTENVIHGVLDILFTHLMREVISVTGQSSTNWSRGAQDPSIQKALELMHADSARAWSLVELARQVGMSRAGLAERFKRSMGDTPLHYLRNVRMQRAMHLLTSTEHSLETIAQSVGYQDAFSFSKVFKRTVGLSPRDFRKKDQQEKNLAWRA